MFSSLKSHKRKTEKKNSNKSKRNLEILAIFRYNSEKKLELGISI